MCGIVGVVGAKNPAPVVLEGLKRLEYRGYDSAGLASVANGQLAVRRSVGKIAALEETLNQQPLGDTRPVAIGHTRWATHGAPTETNAHPHQSGVCAVVHNGIIENYQDIRARLQKDGVTFHSETDSETLPALINKALDQGKTPFEAVADMVGVAEGAFAVGIVFENHPDLMMATRRSAPLVVGIGDGKNYVGSDPTALAPFTNKFIFLEDDDVAEITSAAVVIRRPNGEEVTRPVHTLDLSGALAGKAGHPHFMLKEIYEQPAVISRLLQTYVDAQSGTINLPDLPVAWDKIPQISFVACGTAYYACLAGKYLIEQQTGIPVQVDMASEFRYRQPPLAKGGLFVAVSQSGETADTLAALEHAQASGQHVLAVTNTPTSSIARAADAVLDLMADAEIAVASTKAFTAMVLSMQLISLVISQSQNKDLSIELKALRELPAKITETLALEGRLKEMAQQVKDAHSMFYLGRGSLFPLALEGALKIKEISYIHAEAYPSGEMKHGPIALIDKGFPIINLAASTDGLFEKTLSNMKEVQARGGFVVLITDAQGAKQGQDAAAATLALPAVPAFTLSILYAIPMQLLAYHVAVAKGTDVDQPRNLAKSVTVE